jgi:hypothetical protein
MFHNSFNVQMTPWSLTETSEWMPPVAYPALMGSGQLTIGLDASGLQGLPDRVAAMAGSAVAPFHVTQSELYVLHEGMISEHLSQYEVRVTGTDVPPGETVYGLRKNFMPLGFLSQRFALDGETYPDEALFTAAKQWTRTWDLRRAVFTNRFHLARRVWVELELFMPHGGEEAWIKLTRRAAKGEGTFRWEVALHLTTRDGAAIFDQPVGVGTRTLTARIDPDSPFRPNEPYAVLYGAGAAGMDVTLAPDGWRATLDGPVAEEQTAYLRLAFERLAGAEVAEAPARREMLEAALAVVSADAYAVALAAQAREYAEFWGTTADIAVAPEDATELTRRFMLHMTEYLLHCGSDFSCGGSPQFAFMHQNGWGASNFHDQHYVVDGLARANLWPAAEAHAHWLRRVMRPTGRAFPWMMTYDGTITAPPEVDRAPMSDAGRALLAMRLYELAGRGRETLLRDTVYPILRRVADMAVSDWFVERDGRMIFRGVETDVMGEHAIEHDASTVLAFLTVLRKAMAYGETLGVDADRRAAWGRVVEATTIPVVAGRYQNHQGAAPDTLASGWLCHSYYIAEAQPFLDDRVYADTVDYSHRQVVCNIPWIGYAVAGSELRLGRPDRAEQYAIDHLEHRLHGPGYFEECYPLSIAATPPFESAHGSHLTFSCEQVVMSDFWAPRIFVGRGMPSKFRANTVTFSNLRARDGVLVSGVSTPRRLAVTLHHTGDPVTQEVVLSVPCEAGVTFRVLRDGADVEHAFHGETVTVTVALAYGETTELVVEG